MTRDDSPTPGRGFGLAPPLLKLAASVQESDVRHLRWLREKAGPRLLDAIVLTTGPEAYRPQDGIGVVPLALLGP